jgi:hypothetical protein
MRVSETDGAVLPNDIESRHLLPSHNDLDIGLTAAIAGPLPAFALAPDWPAAVHTPCRGDGADGNSLDGGRLTG